MAPATAAAAIRSIFAAAFATICAASAASAQPIDAYPRPAVPDIGAALGSYLTANQNLVAPVLSGRIDDLAPGLADLARLRAALDAVEDDDWPAARATIADADDPALPAFVDWLDFRRDDSAASFEEIAAFIAAHPDWPQSGRLRRRAEAALSGSVGAPDARAVMRYFDRFPPLGGAAVLFYFRARSAEAAGAPLDAAHIRKAWVDTDFGTDDEAAFADEFGSLLTVADHVARLDRLAWEQRHDAARRMFRYVDAGQIALAEARLALTRQARGVTQLIAKVPDGLREDPALMYERLRWRRRENLDDGAIEILRAPPPELGRPERWGLERNIIARRALENGDYNLAFEIAVAHDLTRGARFAELEFLAGWIALTQLDAADSALDRFVSLYHRTSMPISRARGAYWAGRAAAALGDTALAQRWYEFAARHPTAFYGQQALLELGRDVPPIETARQPGAADRAAVQRTELMRIAEALLALGEADHVPDLLLAAAHNTRSAAQQRLIAERAVAAEMPHVAVAIAKFAVRQTGSILEIGYPIPAAVRTAGAVPSTPTVTPSVPSNNGATAPEPALVLALIRQESTFRRDAVSRAGARGLMQLMPATAAQLAGEIGEGYDRNRLLSDPDYNLRLGRYLLGQLLARYDGSYALALAAYNAGPSRVDTWLQEIGDPRGTGRRGADTTAARAPGDLPETGMGSIELIDWIESIPFPETRNYVQRVLEAVTVYRQLLAASGAGAVEQTAVVR